MMSSLSSAMGNEFAGEVEPAIGMTPASQCFKASNVAIFKRDDGLIVDNELVLVDGFAQIGFGFKSRNDPLTHPIIEEFGASFARWSWRDTWRLFEPHEKVPPLPAPVTPIINDTKFAKRQEPLIVIQRTSSCAHRSKRQHQGTISATERRE